MFFSQIILEHSDSIALTEQVDGTLQTCVSMQVYIYFFSLYIYKYLYIYICTQILLTDLMVVSGNFPGGLESNLCSHDSNPGSFSMEVAGSVESTAKG